MNTNINPTECVFIHGGQCDHTALSCGQPCSLRMHRIDGLTYRDHFELYERRKAFRYDVQLKRVTLLLSLMALVLGVANLVWTMFKP